MKKLLVSLALILVFALTPMTVNAAPSAGTVCVYQWLAWSMTSRSAWQVPGTDAVTGSKSQGYDSWDLIGCSSTN